MARIHHAPDGRIARVDRPGMPPGLADPPGTTAVEFDDATNPTLAAEVAADADRWSYSGGVLRRDGQAVTIAPDALETADRKDFGVQAEAWVADLQAIVDGVDASSNAQLRDMVKRMARIQRRMVRRLARLTERLGDA